MSSKLLSDMSARPRTILITGCSEGSLGDALAQAFHARGQRVIATARNPARLAHFKALGIETLTLDVLSAESISACVAAVAEKTGGSLDMLLNNSGGGYTMPLLDADLDESRKLFELNVWSVLAVIKAFTPLLLKSTLGPIIVNNTAVASAVVTPFMGIYSASKAAVASMTDTLRLELEPWGVKVVDLKTGGVRSHFYDNQQGGAKPKLPEGSFYSVAREHVETILAGTNFEETWQEREPWARRVVGDLLKSSPPVQIWRGGNAVSGYLTTLVPWSWYEHLLLKLGGVDVVKQKLEASVKSG